MEPTYPSRSEGNLKEARIVTSQLKVNQASISKIFPIHQIQVQQHSNTATQNKIINPMYSSHNNDTTPKLTTCNPSPLLGSLYLTQSFSLSTQKLEDSTTSSPTCFFPSSSSKIECVALTAPAQAPTGQDEAELSHFPFPFPSRLVADGLDMDSIACRDRRRGCRAQVAAVAGGDTQLVISVIVGWGE